MIEVRDNFYKGYRYMPYTEIYKKGDKFCFKNKDNSKERCSLTKDKCIKMLSLLQGIEHGMIIGKKEK